MRRVIITLALLWSIQLSAQNVEETAVMDVVNRVFEAMRTNDSTLLKTCFTKDVRMSTVFSDANGKTKLQDGELTQFVSAVGKTKTDVLNEPIWNEKVLIDGSFASVWVDYALYLNTNFSHCGVDAFHLLKTDEGWKIFNLVDTRRKLDCEIPEDIKTQFGG